MDSGVLTAMVMALSAVLVAAVGGWYTYRASRRNSEATREIEQDKLSTESWEKQVKAWREDVVALRQQRAEDSRLYGEHLTLCTTQVEQLTVKVREMQRQRDDDEERHRRERRETQDRIDSLVAWIRAVAPLAKERGVPFPSLPPGIIDGGLPGFNGHPKGSLPQ